MPRQTSDASSEQARGEMRPRRVKISSQMQVRIPSEFYQAFGFGTEAICVATKTGVEYRPVRNAIEESADIIRELADKGLSGDELADEYVKLAESRINRPLSADDFSIDAEEVDLRHRGGNGTAKS